MKYHLGVVSNYQVQVFAVPVLLNILLKKKSCYVFLNMHNRNRVMESQKHKNVTFTTLVTAQFFVCKAAIVVTMAMTMIAAK